MRAIRSLENWVILLKGTTENITSQEREFLNFYRSLWCLLQSMKCIFTPLAKTVLVPLALIAGVSATDEAIENNFFWSDMTTLLFSN